MGSLRVTARTPFRSTFPSADASTDSGAAGAAWTGFLDAPNGLCLHPLALLAELPATLLGLALRNGLSGPTPSASSPFQTSSCCAISFALLNLAPSPRVCAIAVGHINLPYT